jgi:hypothetical protein
MLAAMRSTKDSVRWRQVAARLVSTCRALAPWRVELALARLLGWAELSPRKFHRWQDRYGKANEHNALIPRDHWLEPWEGAAIVDFGPWRASVGARRQSAAATSDERRVLRALSA